MTIINSRRRRRTKRIYI